MANNNTAAHQSACDIPTQVDYSQVKIVEIDTTVTIANYAEALVIAHAEAEKYFDDAMLLSSYDHERDFEIPQHAGECHVNSAIPGYIDYALYHGATLKIVLNKEQYSFFYYAF
jgi:hypothetical protein